MNLYPWLKNDYEKIIYPHYINKNHHAIIIESQTGLGSVCLLKNIGLWILCKNKTMYSCGICQSCRLMHTNNHPDWHDLKLLQHFSKDLSKKISINTIRYISNIIFKSAHQGENKIIYISNINDLTESAINALLKIVEEPPKNTYFLFINYIPHKFISTLKSRCIIYNISTPKIQKSIQWLKKKYPNLNKTEYITALKTNHEAPLLAEKYITSSCPQERKLFFKYFLHSIQKKNLLHIIDIIIKTKNLEKKIFWICSIILDAIKWKYNINQTIINIDQINIIKILSLKFSIKLLSQSYQLWINCLKTIKNIPNINLELLLIKKILSWEEILKIFIT